MNDDPEIRSFSWVSLGAKFLAWLGYAFLVIPSLIVIPLSFGDSQILVFPPPNLLLAHTIVVFPLVMVTANAGLRQIDRGLETAASLMGAGKLQVLRRVTLPLLLPSVLAAGLFAFLMSFDEVVISYFIASVRQMTLP